MIANELFSKLKGLGASASGFARSNPLLSSGIAGVTALGGIATIVRAKRRKTRKKAKSKRKTRKTTKRKTRKKTKKSCRSRRVVKSRSKRIRLTKNGQPYIILSNGRARFIKRSSASRRRKLKGGYY